jgi:hypothetical protein
MPLSQPRHRRARWSRVIRGLMATAMLLLAMPAGIWAEAAPAKEYQIKAAFLLRFIQFVELPEQAFADAEAPIRIGVLGEDPFGSALDHIITGEKIRERPLLVKRGRSPMELSDCHLIFVALSEKDRLQELSPQLPMTGVLTISDIGGFAERGGMIRFFMIDKKIRFELNPTVARQHQLKVSAQLLSLAKIVGPPIGTGAP